MSFLHNLLLFLVGVTSSSLFAESSYSMNIMENYSQNWQIAHHGQVVFDHFEHTGYVTFDGTIVKNDTLINGYMHGRFIEFGPLFVNGHAKIEDCTLKNQVRINGKLLAINTNFNDLLTCIGNEKIVLSHCRTKSIHIKAIPGYAEPQILVLAEFSEVNGDIVFEAGRGKVIADKKTTVKKIKGGRLSIQ